MATNGKLPYDLYLRVASVGKRDERLRSFDFQEADGMRLAEQERITVGLVVRDPDQSGANPKRKRLLRLIERVEHGESGGIIVAKLDRFARKMWVATSLAQRIYDAGGEILSWAERGDLTTPDGRVRMNLAWLIAEFERDTRAEGLERSKEEAVAKGVPIRPRLAPGLRLIEQMNKRGDELIRTGVEADPEVASTMAEFFERRVQGAGPVALGNFLTEHGVKTAYGSTRWSKQAVYDLIRNVAYIGVLKEGEYVKENVWPPIVDRATFAAAQHPERRQPAKARTAEPQLLTGLARCASCRYCLQPTIHRGRRLYRCAGAAGECPGRARAYVDELDPVVLEAFWQLVEVHHARGSVIENTAEVDALRAAAAKSERAFLRLRDDPEQEATIEAMGGMDQWREALKVKRLRWESDSAALGRAEARQRATPQVPLEADLRDSWEAMEAGERRELLASLIDTVALLPRSTGLPLEERVVIFAAGHGPTDLPARGHLARPAVRPFELPAGAGAVALQNGNPTAA